MNEHKTRALLTNFGLKIFHTTGDGETAEYASSLLGHRLERLTTFSPKPPESMGEEIFGPGSGSCSMAESYQPVLQARAFMSGLRTGGGANDCTVDGIVIRSGECFASGENWLKVAFSQR